MKNITEVEVTEELGLCLTCSHHATCTTRKSFKGKIFQCEEFDTSGPEQPLSASVPAVPSEGYQYSELKGLCMNCDLAATCTLPKSSHGVWHCNEYK